MYGILQTGDDPGHLHQPNVINEGNSYIQQQKLQESIKNSSNNGQIRAELPYPQVNLQVLSPASPVLRSKGQHNEQKEVKILLEKRYKNN